uniref:MADS-box domain-containing protein n=1 Tax=Solanum lycopersicum TaxID=4081 RepID=A0A3Q7J9Y1_SOLLC
MMIFSFLYFQSRNLTKVKKNRQVAFSKRRIGIFKKASEQCTLCGAYVAVVIFSSRNKVYSSGHPSAELIVDKFLGENQPDFDAPNSTSLSHQNVNGKALQGLRKELPYEQLSFSDLKKLIELLIAADEEVERVASQLMEYDTEFPYQTIKMCLSPLRVDGNSSSNFNEAQE